MANLEKVIRGLQAIHDEAYDRWVHTQYGTDKLVALMSEVVPDALTLLREQEPVEPHAERDCDDGIWYYGCGACHGAIDYKDKFCRHCGREVKWDE